MFYAGHIGNGRLFVADDKCGRRQAGTEREPWSRRLIVLFVLTQTIMTKKKAKMRWKQLSLFQFLQKGSRRFRNKQEKEKRPHTDYLGLLGVQKSRRWLELTAYNFWQVVWPAQYRRLQSQAIRLLPQEDNLCTLLKGAIKIQPV